MKTFWYVIFILSSPVLAISFYMYFHVLEFSKNQVDWGAFGSFIGGVSAPVVAAITLIFLIQSNKSQSRQTAQKISLELIESHKVMTDRFKLSSPSQGLTEGGRSLDYLWQALVSIGDFNSDAFKNQLKTIESELESIVKNTAYILVFIEDDNYLTEPDKLRILNLWVSKLHRSELKMLFALTLRDENLKKALSNPNHNYMSIVSLTSNEKLLMDHVIQSWGA